MPTSWSLLSDSVQLVLSREALAHAVLMVAGHAESLAEEIESGGLADRGGPDALRLLAAVMRAGGSDMEAAGHA